MVCVRFHEGLTKIADAGRVQWPAWQHLDSASRRNAGGGWLAEVEVHGVTAVQRIRAWPLAAACSRCQPVCPSWELWSGVCTFEGVSTEERPEIVGPITNADKENNKAKITSAIAGAFQVLNRV